MHFEPLDISGAWTIDLERNVDERGFFARTFCEREFAERGLPTHFPQCNLSSNRRARTMRGMHMNTAEHAESKLVRCVRGAIFDVIVDLRAGSPTFGASVGVELTVDNRRAIFVPEGCAHGFLTLLDESDVYYHMGSSYVPEAGRGFRWDDPAFCLEWPHEPLFISQRDAGYPDFDPTSWGTTT